MKFILIFMATTVFGAFTTASAKVSHGTMMFGDQANGTHITHLTDLPDIEKFKIDGKYFDLGWAHTRVRLFMFPLWGSADGNYVLYVKRGYGWEYHNIPMREAEAYAKHINLKLSQLPYIKSYENFAGTILFAGPLFIVMLLLRGLWLRLQPERPEDKIKYLTINKLNEFEEKIKIKKNRRYFRGKI